MVQHHLVHSFVQFGLLLGNERENSLEREGEEGRGREHMIKKSRIEDYSNTGSWLCARKLYITSSQRWRSLGSRKS